MFNKDSSKYAFVKVFGEYGYGHIYAAAVRKVFIDYERLKEEKK